MLELFIGIVFFLIICLVVAFILKWLENWNATTNLKRVKGAAHKILDASEIADPKRYYKIVNYLAQTKDDLEAADLLEELQQLKAQG